MMNKVALIIPYFGILPEWFPYFVKSAAASPILEVLLFTDSPVEITLPENITVIPFSLGSFNELASQRLSISISVTNPYKLCDFKPAFGEIFHEYIRGFEFWAFGDIDLVYGDVAAFLDPLLEGNDVISFCKGWVSGSLCVLRNSTAITRLYKLSPDWERVFLNQANELFDEMGGHFYPHVLSGADVLTMRGSCESFTHIVTRLQRKGVLKCTFVDLACEEIAWGMTLKFRHGKLICTNNGRPIMYVHYVALMRRFFEVPQTSTVPDEFYVRNTGIYLNRPNLLAVCLDEPARVMRGAMQGVGRFIRRHTGGLLEAF
jgi:hypothetical protein